MCVCCATSWRSQRSCISPAPPTGCSSPNRRSAVTSGDLINRPGVPLLQRTTRRVTLTPAGEQLLVRARELLALHDQTLRELQGLADRVVVDVVGHGLTPETVLAAARRRGPDVEYFAEFHGGLELALPLLQARRLDVTFGRLAGVTAATDDGFAQRLIRLERIAVLLPAAAPPGRSARRTSGGAARPRQVLAGRHARVDRVGAGDSAAPGRFRRRRGDQPSAGPRPRRAELGTSSLPQSQDLGAQ